MQVVQLLGATANSIKSYEIDLLSPSNDSIKKLVSSLKEVISEYLDTTDNMSFSAIVDKIFDASLEKENITGFLRQKSSNYIKAVIAVELI